MFAPKFLYGVYAFFNWPCQPVAPGLVELALLLSDDNPIHKSKSIAAIRHRIQSV